MRPTSPHIAMLLPRLHLHKTVVECVLKFNDLDINELGEAMIKVNESTQDLIESSDKLKSDLDAVVITIDNACLALIPATACDTAGIKTSELVLEVNFSNVSHNVVNCFCKFTILNKQYIYVGVVINLQDESDNDL